MIKKTAVLFANFLCFCLFFSEHTHAKNIEITTQKITNTIPKNGIRIPVLSIQIKTVETPIKIEEVHIRRTGLSSHSDIEGLRAYSNNRRTRRAPLLSDDIARIRFTTPLVIPAQSQEKIIITANFQLEESHKTIGFELEKIMTTQENPKLHITQKEDQKSTRTQSNRYQRMPSHPYSVESKTNKPSYRKAYRYRGSRNYRGLFKRYERH